MSKQSDQKKPKPQQKEDLHQEKLTAIVLLDSYTKNFEPLKSVRAECLLPLPGGKTLLDNNVEFLIENGIEEIYLFCTKHHQQIKNYIEEKKWRKQIEIHFLYNFKCKSLGDAMREIDAKGLVRSNFILMTGPGVISNINLKEYLETHKQVTKSDKNALMTMLCVSNQNDLTHFNTKNDHHSSTLIVHDINRKILHYDHIFPNSISKVPFETIKKAYTSAKQSANLTQQAVDSANAKFKLQQEQNQFSLNATSGFQGGNSETILHLKTIQNRNDLVESQIYFCTPHVLNMFTDNFDYDNMRDYVHGVLADEEVSGYTIYIDEFIQKYGSHCGLIKDLNSYFCEIMRLLSRTDLVLDYNSRAKYDRLLDTFNVNLSKNSLKIGNNTKFNRNVFVESSTRIGANSTLTNCYIGSNCIIGNNVNLSNTIIYPNTKIGNKTTINGCLISSNVKIGNNCSICENTLISDYCKVKDNTAITERAVYFTSESEKFKSRTKSGTDSQTDESNDENDLTKQFEKLNLEVKEKNYSKYILADHDDDEEDDEEFGSDDEDCQVRDDESVSSDGSEGNNDTSKNNHFLVIKSRVRRESRSALARQNYYGSDLALSCIDTEGYVSSSDEDDFDKSDVEEAADDDNAHEANHEEETEMFLREVIGLLKNALEENLDLSNVILEINSRKHAYGIQIDDVCYYLAKAVLYLPFTMCGVSPNKSLEAQQEAVKKFDYLAKLKGYLIKFGPILQNYYTTTKKSQRLFLNSLQDFFVETKLYADQAENVFLDSFYVKSFHFMYNECDFLDQDIIIDWYEKQVEFLKVSRDQDLSKLEIQQRIQTEKILKNAYSIRKLEQFIEWLKEEDDDDED